MLKDPDETVRRQAVRAVMHIHPGPQVTIPLCVKLLEDSDPGVRIRILNAIAEAGPKAVPALIEALKNEKAVYWACLVLREWGLPPRMPCRRWWRNCTTRVPRFAVKPS